MIEMGLESDIESEDRFGGFDGRGEVIRDDVIQGYKEPRVSGLS